MEDVSLSRRPLAWAAAAVFAGSALGASGALSEGGARAIVLAVPLLCIAIGRLGASTLASRHAAVLALIVGAAGLRSSLATETSAIAPPEPAVGPWKPTGSFGDREFGRLGGCRDRYAVPAGVLAEGDLAAFLPGETPPTWARGPEPGPSRRIGLDRPSIEVEADGIVRLSTAPSSPWELLSRPLFRLRRILLARVSDLDRPLTRGLVAGLLFGDVTEIPDGVPDLFVRTGTYHVLAISGLQVAFVAVLLAGPLARALAALARILSLGRATVGPEAFRAVLLLLFVPVAGAGAPVARSTLAWALGSLAPIFRSRRPFSVIESGPEVRAGVDRMPRSPDSLSLWSLALLLECLLHPDAPLSLSVQLSYAATLGLILLTRPVARALRHSLPGGGRISEVGPTGRPRSALGRIAAQRTSGVLIDAVAASLAASLTTLPLVWWRFGEWCPAGILATPAIALPVAWTLVFGWLWLLAPNAVPEILLDLPSEAMVHLLDWFDRFPGSPCPLPHRPLFLLVGAAAASILAARRLGSGASELHPRGPHPSSPHPSSPHWGLARACALAWALLLLPWTTRPRSLELQALDVGHGTAVVLRSPGGAVWVFDAGSRDRPGVDREALGPMLRDLEVARIGVILSHPDRDHDGGLGWLIERYPARVWAGAVPAHIAARLPHTSFRIDVELGSLRLPDLGRGETHLELDLARSLDTDGNEGSRTLEISWKGQRIVLCGDAEAEGLAAWIRQPRSCGPAQVLFLPHHGSDTEHMARLLEAVRPSEIWISVSGIAPLERELDRRGIRWRSTAADGPLRLELP